MEARFLTPEWIARRQAVEDAAAKASLENHASKPKKAKPVTDEGYCNLIDANGFLIGMEPMERD